MFKGWFKVHRSLFDNDLWLAEPFTKGQAWVDLMGHANHKPASVWIRGIEVSVGRGQLAWSELTMAKRWQWSRGKVRRYLGMLEKRQMIEQQKNELTTVLTICNYELYQGSDTTDETASSTTDKTAGDTPDGQQAVHKQECKNGENVKEKPPKPPKGDDVPLDEIIDLYHRMLPELPQAANYTDTRVKQLKARWSETVQVPAGNGEFETMKCASMDFWERFFRRVRGCPLLLGEKNGWHASLDWLTKKANFYKVIEGNYVE